MPILPFLYFLLLLIYERRKNKTFFIGSYIIMLYVITSFFAILIDILDLYGSGGVYPKSQDTFLLATFMYCFLLTLCLIPFARLKQENFQIITMRKPILFKYLVYFFFVIFLISIYFMGSSILSFTDINIYELRKEHYSNDIQNYQTGLSGLPYLASFILNIFSYFSPLMLLFFFYSIIFLKNSWKFNLMIMLSSLTQMIMSIQTVDRTNIIFYLLILGFCFTLFRPLMSKKQINKVLISISTVVFILFTYLYFVTTSRFEMSEGGALGGFIQYGGQSYNNFCFLFENYRAPNISTLRLFPLTNHFIFGEDYGIERREFLINQTGLFTSVFSTFLGTFLIDLGHVGMFIYAISFSILSNYISNLNIKKRSVDFSWFILLFVIASIPIFGIFYYRYFNYGSGFFILCAILLYILFKYKLKR